MPSHMAFKFLFSLMQMLLSLLLFCLAAGHADAASFSVSTNIFCHLLHLPLVVGMSVSLQ